MLLQEREKPVYANRYNSEVDHAHAYIVLVAIGLEKTYSGKVWRVVRDSPN